MNNMMFIIGKTHIENIAKISRIISVIEIVRHVLFIVLKIRYKNIALKMMIFKAMIKIQFTYTYEISFFSKHI